MGKGQKIETSYLFTPAEAADFLRQLADRLEDGRLDPERAELELSGQVKVKQSIKDKAGKRSIKLKVKLSEAEPLPPEEMGEEKEAPAVEAESGMEKEAGTEEGAAPAKPEPQPEAEAPPKAPARKPSYKRLKKKMGDNYKALKAALREGTLPEAALMEQFLDQCRRMVTYPDKGDPYYEEFAKATDELAQAASKGDSVGMEAAVAEMGRVRKNCHRRFK